MGSSEVTYLKGMIDGIDLCIKQLETLEVASWAEVGKQICLSTLKVMKKDFEDGKEDICLT